MNLKNNKKKVFICLSVVVAILAITFAAVYAVRSLSRVTTDDAYVDGRFYTVAAKVGGTVKEVYVNDNQGVKKGELLFEIDPVDYELKVNDVEASLEVKNVLFEQALRDKVRAEALYRQEIYPKERYENVCTACNLAKAQLKAAEAQLKIARRNLEYTKVYAPSNGYVTKKSVETGNQIQAGQPLMAVVDMGDVWVTANYKETQLKNVKVGQRAEIKVDTYPGSIFTGKVESIMAGTGSAFSLFPPENALGNYVKVVQRIPVKIVFDNGTCDKHKMHIGMSCIPTIFTQNESGK
jgi:membrane fusion protein (multidrug efflux system)